MINRSTTGTGANEVAEIARLNRERVRLARFHQHSVGGPKERQFRPEFFETDAETVRAEIQERKLLLLDEGSHRTEDLIEHLQLQMERFNESACLAFSAEKKVRTTLLDAIPIVQGAINAIERKQ